MQRRDGYVKVLDFGLARITISENTQADTLAHEGTAPGVVLGTSAYMSPEQAQGQTVGPPSDVFSLGVVLYEMATAKRPFSLDGGLAVLHAIIRSHPLPPSRHVPELPSTFDGLIARMLAKDPALRPSAEDVQRELDAIAGGDRTPQTAADRRAPADGRARPRARRAAPGVRDDGRPSGEASWRSPASPASARAASRRTSSPRLPPARTTR